MKIGWLRFQLALILLLLCSTMVWSQKANFTKDTAIINRLNRQADEAQRARDMEHAQQLASRALDSSLQVGYQEGLSHSLLIMGLTHQRTSNPKKALEYYRRALSLAGNSNRLQLDIIRNSGNCHNDLGNYDSAIVLFNNLLEIATSQNLETEISRAYNNLGISYDSKGELLLALDYYQKSLDIKAKLDDKKGIASTLNNIGVVLYNQGDIPRAVESFMKSLKVKEELGDLASVANTYNNIGVIYKEQNQLQEALEFYQKAFEINTSIGDRRASAVSLLNKGMLFYQIGKVDESLDIIKKSLSINKEIGAKQSEINALFSLGEIYLNIGQADSSRFFLKRAETLCLETGDKRNLAHVRTLLAKNYLETKNWGQSIRSAQSALGLAKETNSATLQRDALETLSLISEKVGDYKNALDNYKQFISLRDTLSNNERSKQIWRIQMQSKYEKMLETEKYKQEQAMTFAQLATNRQVLVSRTFMLISILVLVVASIIFYHYRVSRKLSVSLQLQKQEIEQQKEEILAQRDEIENQKDLVTIQRDRIMDLFTEISESVMYAQRIQLAMLPSERQMKTSLGDHFVFMKPKQVVSGDFYWVTQSGTSTYIATVDCTGHGMPGGFMSMLGTTLLNELILHHPSSEPNLILDLLRDKVIITLSQKGHFDDNVDGMDIALIKLNQEKNSFQYAGANMPVWIARPNNEPNPNAELFELVPDRMPISFQINKKPFAIQSFNLEKGDMIYMFSDGFADQFGGINGKKFRVKQFRQVIQSMAHLPTNEQRRLLETTFTEWQGEHFQVDDVLVFGIRV